MDNVETVESGQTFAQALEAFEAAWVDPRHTAIQLPPVDVNKVLADRYTVEPAVHMTRQQLWDMEVRKAWDPLTYIPYVVSEGKSWASIPLPGNGRRHLRSSIQKAWISDDRGRVLEEVVSDLDGQRIIFLGHAELPGPDGTTAARRPLPATVPRRARRRRHRGRPDQPLAHPRPHQRARGPVPRAFRRNGRRRVGCRASSRSTSNVTSASSCGDADPAAGRGNRLDFAFRSGGFARNGCVRLTLALRRPDAGHIPEGRESRLGTANAHDTSRRVTYKACSRGLWCAVRRFGAPE